MKKDKNTYSLINFLIKKRKDIRGLLSPVCIKMGDFPKYYFTNGEEIIGNEYLLKLIDDLRLIAGDYKKNGFKILNKEVLDALYKQNTGLTDDQKDMEICFEFGREEMEKYKEDNEIGDGIKRRSKKLEDKITPLRGLPENLTWDKVEIKFTDEHMEKVRIRIDGDFFCDVDFKAFGCSKTKNKIEVPDINWEFLKAMSLLIQHGIRDRLRIKSDFNREPVADETFLTKDNLKYAMESNFKNSEEYKNKKVSKESIWKYKEHISECLKYFFSTRLDPFHNYNEYKCYMPRFILKPYKELLYENAEVNISKKSGDFDQDMVVSVEEYAKEEESDYSQEETSYDGYDDNNY